MKRILVATDRSDTSTRAVEWAAEMADRYSAELVVVRVVAPEHVAGGDAGTASAAAELSELAERHAGARGRARLEFDSQPAEAIVAIAHEERADIVVVGNVSMSGRTQFLLGSVPNRVSHAAPCTVVIVNTRGTDGGPASPRREEEAPRVAASDGEVLGRAARIAAVAAKYQLRGVLERTGDPETSEVAQAQRLRNALEELGPTFAKLGQILSTRPDLLPPAFIGSSRHYRTTSHLCASQMWWLQWSGNSASRGRTCSRVSSPSPWRRERSPRCTERFCSAAGES